ncbi:YgaP family membrane protein [Legionella fallonii]|uniref:Inner membrane protein YgaP-like transmembrane domain-containing protein n=1 Tax=Legionella fallonii LLAP-10 TaxID=1212491 RepID=A0A098G7C7_9GAMM|nr:DUF2892 domain-containing protein [Legionella fallonii]CEG57906.1 protein of unknown function [Legionella fallonii LLAP-10]
MSFTCNIDKTDRVNRIIIGVGLCLAALVGLGQFFYITLGLILVIEGLIGWCSIPYFITKIKSSFSLKEKR